jgi:predicted RNA polymerase sigma factor
VGTVATIETHQAIETVFRIERAKLIAGLARMVRDVGLAEELAQDAVDIVLKDAPIVAGAVHALAKFLATYDRKHLLAQAALIQDRFGIAVGTPGAVLDTIG